MATKKLLTGRPIDLGQGVIFTPGRRLAGSVQELPLPRPTRKIRGISDPWGRLESDLESQTAVRFSRAVFVGTPNAGTPLASTNNLGTFIDHLTNALLFLPKFSVVMVVDLILSVVKWLATRATGNLPGLVAQSPTDPFLRQLNSASSVPRAQYAAVAANYEPEQGLLNRLKDSGADLLMRVDNDLVIPTASMTTVDPGASPPPLMADRVCHFDGGKVHHTNYFEQEQTVQFIRQVLQ